MGATCLAATARAAGPAEEQPPNGTAVVVPKESPKPAKVVEPAKPVDIFFVEGETGGRYVGLETLSVKRDVVPRAVRRADVGAFVGAAAGLKLVFLTLGPHFQLGHFQDWDLWTLDIDLGWHAPLGKFEPFLRLGGGYARLNRAFDSATAIDQTPTVHGYHASLAIGADYFATPYLTLGGRVSGDLLALYRVGVDINSQDGIVNDYYKYDGAGVGLGLAGALALGLHF